MAIERTDILDKEQDEEAKAAREELESLREKARSEELGRVRAEAELDATKRFSTQPQTMPQAQAWTEEQWQQAETSSGMTRQQLITANTIADERAKAANKAIEERLKAAEDRAARAEEKANKFESSRGYDSQVNKFIDSKPALRAYKDDVEGFLNKFPEDMKKDPAKLKELMADAEVYVRGKVGGNKMRSSGNGSSARLGGGNEFDEQDSAPSIDLSDLDDRHQRRVVEDIWEETKGVDTKDLEKYLSNDKTTVKISAEDEFKNWKK